MRCPATAANYTWIRDVSNGMFLDAYCLTLVLGLTDEDLFERLGVDEYVATTGISEAANTSMEWLIEHGSERFVAVTPVERGALMIEPGGILGVTPAVALPFPKGMSWFRISATSTPTVGSGASVTVSSASSSTRSSRTFAALAAHPTTSSTRWARSALTWRRRMPARPRPTAGSPTSPSRGSGRSQGRSRWPSA
jgi:hypothetical protein